MLNLNEEEWLGMYSDESFVKLCLGRLESWLGDCLIPIGYVVYTMSICYLLLLSTDVSDVFVRFWFGVGDLPRSESALVELVGTMEGCGEGDGAVVGLFDFEGGDGDG